MKAYILPLVLVAALATSASAADTTTLPTKPAAAATAVKAPKRYPYHANVAAIDVSAKKITLDGKKKQRVLYITPATRVLKDKKPVALETIKVGEYITGSLVDTDGRLEPTTVNVGGTTQKPAAQTAQTTPAQSAAAAPPQQSSSIKVTKPNGSVRKQ
jgi:Cu/Ag efflux protein CusF